MRKVVERILPIAWLVDRQVLSSAGVFDRDRERIVRSPGNQFRADEFGFSQNLEDIRFREIGGFVRILEGVVWQLNKQVRHGRLLNVVLVSPYNGRATRLSGNVP